MLIRFPQTRGLRTQVDPFCDHCYAMMLDARWFKRAHWGPGAARRYFNDEYWAQPLEWHRRGRVASSRALHLVIGSDNALPGLSSPPNLDIQVIVADVIDGGGRGSSSQYAPPLLMPRRTKKRRTADARHGRVPDDTPVSGRWSFRQILSAILSVRPASPPTSKPVARLRTRRLRPRVLVRSQIPVLRVFTLSVSLTGRIRGRRSREGCHGSRNRQ
jgi:hypothetical protein